MWMVISIIVVIAIIVVVRVQDKHKSNTDSQLLENLMGDNTSMGRHAVAYNFDIVGEQSYQKNLSKIAGKKEEKSKFIQCHANVSSEPFNKYDKNAIKVEINGLLVGYISKNEAAQLAGRVINKTVPAVINGGWKDQDSTGSYGVRLAINSVYDLV